MKAYTKNDLGKKLNTIYYPPDVSIQEYENGWIIKPCKQEPIVISKNSGEILAMRMRNKRELFTMIEAKKILWNQCVDKV